MGNSLYPSQIDGYSQLRIVRDGIDEIIASDPNSLRSSILAIENTLGINPQGSFGTVSARLDSTADAYALIVSHIHATSDAHPASAISIADAGNFFISTNVEGALQELGGLLSQQPNQVGQNQTVIPNSAIPSFYDGYGTLFTYNGSAASIQQRGQPSNIAGLTILA